jgi:hypothetical protein
MYMYSCLVAFMFMDLDGLTLMPLLLTTVIVRTEYLRFDTTHLILSKTTIHHSVPGMPLEHGNIL